MFIGSKAQTCYIPAQQIDGFILNDQSISSNDKEALLELSKTLEWDVECPGFSVLPAESAFCQGWNPGNCGRTWKNLGTRWVQLATHLVKNGAQAIFMFECML